MEVRNESMWTQSGSSSRVNSCIPSSGRSSSRSQRRNVSKLHVMSQRGRSEWGVLHVPRRLLVGRLHASLARLGFIEVDADGLLFAKEMMVAHEDVDAPSAYLALEVDERRHRARGHPENVHQKVLPELRGILLLVVLPLGNGGENSLPAPDELLGICRGGHVNHFLCGLLAVSRCSLFHAALHESLQKRRSPP